MSYLLFMRSDCTGSISRYFAKLWKVTSLLKTLLKLTELFLLILDMYVRMISTLVLLPTYRALWRAELTCGSWLLTNKLLNLFWRDLDFLNFVN